MMPKSAHQTAFTPPCESNPNANVDGLPPLGMDGESIRQDFRHYYSHYLGRDKFCASAHYPYAALALTVRARLMERWKNTLLRLRRRPLQARLLHVPRVPDGARAQ